MPQVGVEVDCAIPAGVSTMRPIHVLPCLNDSQENDVTELLGAHASWPTVVHAPFPRYSEWRAARSARELVEKATVQCNSYCFRFAGDRLEVADMFSGKSDPFLCLCQRRPVRICPSIAPPLRELELTWALALSGWLAGWLGIAAGWCCGACVSNRGH